MKGPLFIHVGTPVTNRLVALGLEFTMHHPVQRLAHWHIIHSWATPLMAVAVLPPVRQLQSRAGREVSWHIPEESELCWPYLETWAQRLDLVARVQLGEPWVPLSEELHRTLPVRVAQMLLTYA